MANCDKALVSYKRNGKIATLLCTTCYTRLATLLKDVGCCNQMAKCVQLVLSNNVAVRCVEMLRVPSRTLVLAKL